MTRAIGVPEKRAASSRLRARNVRQRVIGAQFVRGGVWCTAIVTG